MARGLQKVQAQQKNAEKQKAQKGGQSHLAGHANAVKIVCPACKQPMANINNLKEHMPAKHAALPEPDYDAIQKACMGEPAPLKKKK